MKRLACLFVLGAAATSTGGCSSGDDVYIETRQSPLCKLSPGEDLCARTWRGLSTAERAEVVTWLDAVVGFSEAARAMVDKVDLACTDLLSKLGLDEPAIAEGSPPNIGVEARCRAAATGLRQRKVWTSVQSLTPTTPCLVLPAASCVAPGENTRVHCAPGEVTFALSPAATDQDRAFASSLQPAIGRLLSSRSDAQALSDWGGKAARVPPAALGGAVPQCLQATATALLVVSSADGKLALELMADVANAVSP